jgi:perosamine synthetase
MILLSKPFFDHEELDEIKKVFESGWVAGQGPKNKELSLAICDYIGTKFAVPVNNCTAGLHLALLALGIRAGDEVIVSDFTYPATGHSVMYCGAVPRFVDVRESTFNINPDLIEDKINRKTKAIIVVHALGQTAEMVKVKEIATKNKLFLIEDCACSLGSSYKGVQSGKYGDIGVFSFHARKNVTSGEGGILVTDNQVFAEKMKLLSCFGMESAFARQNEFTIPSFKELGYNYKLSDINAAIALVQLKKYKKILEKRYELVKHYNERLITIDDIRLPSIAEGATHVYQTYAVVLNPRVNRNNLILKLREKNIQTQIGTYSSFIQPVYKSQDVCPNSLNLYNSTIALPLHLDISENDIDYIFDTLVKNIN